MGQLAQRVVLIHELGQLGGSEEFLHRSGHRFDVDQGLGRDALQVLSGHTLPDYSLQTGQSDPVLVLQQLAYRADPAVAQVVDVIVVAQSVLQVHIIINGSKNIFLGNVLGDQIMDISADRIFQLLDISCGLLQKAGQYRIVYQLCHAHFLGVDINHRPKVHHHIGEHFDITLLIRTLDPYERNRRVLDGIRQLSGHLGPGFRQHFAGQRTHHILRQYMACDPVAEHKLLIKFIPAHFGQVVPSGIKEHAGDQALRTVHCQRLARTDLLIQLQKTFLIIGGSVFFEACHDLRLFSEQFQDLCVRADSKGTDQYRDRHLPGSVYTYIKNVIGVGLIFQPCAPVGDHGTGIQLFAQLVMGNSIINARGTHKLTYNDTLRAIDHKGSRAGHQRQIAHKDLMLVDLIRLLVVESYLYFQRRRVGGVTLLAFLDRVLYVILTQGKVNELQAQVPAVVSDGRNVIKYFF